MILELTNPIEVDTDLGTGYAIILIDYGIHLNTVWVVVLKNNGEIKHFDSNKIKVSRNFTFEINKK